MSKTGLILGFVHLGVFLAVWLLANNDIGCTDLGCLGFIVFFSLPWSLIGTMSDKIDFSFLPLLIIALNFFTYYFIGVGLAKLITYRPRRI